MNIWSDGMYILETISAVDLITVCLITIACVITMVCIIIVSSRSSRKKTRTKDVSFVVADKKEAEEQIISEKREPEEIKEEIKEEKPVTDIQSVLDKMEDELENGAKQNYHTFEEEQEEKAIISYKELLKVAGKLKDEIKENEDAMEASALPIEEERIPVYKEPIKVEKTVERAVQEKESVSERKFRNTDIISPIYGKQSSSIEETYTGKHEEKEEDDFLTQLKDLRKNLE